MFILSQKNGFIYQHRDSYAGDRPDLDRVFEFCEKYLLENPAENWTNKPLMVKEWAEVVRTELN